MVLRHKDSLPKPIFQLKKCEQILIFRLQLSYYNLYKSQDKLAAKVSVMFRVFKIINIPEFENQAI
jgi:hypothetical protein